MSESPTTSQRVLSTFCIIIGILIILLAGIWALLILVGLGLLLLASAVGNSVNPPGWSDLISLLYALGGLIAGIVLIWYGRYIRR